MTEFFCFFFLQNYFQFFPSGVIAVLYLCESKQTQKILLSRWSQVSGSQLQ